MICKAKTFSVAGGVYEAPRCKVYSISAESCILQGSEKYGDTGAAGGDQPYNNQGDGNDF